MLFVNKPQQEIRVIYVITVRRPKYVREELLVLANVLLSINRPNRQAVHCAVVVWVVFL